LSEFQKDHALFVSFAPVDKPKIAVAVIVENGGSGSGIAAPVARKVLDYYLLGIDANAPAPDTDEQAASLTNTQASQSVPQVIDAQGRG